MQADQTDIWQKLSEVFRDVLDNPTLQIGVATTAKDIPEWDSITHVLLISSVEKTFSVRFTAAEMQALQNVGEMVALIEKKKA
jgi:acyl carrier protein